VGQKNVTPTPSVFGNPAPPKFLWLQLRYLGFLQWNRCYSNVKNFVKTSVRLFSNMLRNLIFLIIAWTNLWVCCNHSAGVALNARFTTNGMCSKNNSDIYVAPTNKSDPGVWSLLLLAATVWRFAHLPLGLSDRKRSKLSLNPFVCCIHSS